MSDQEVKRGIPAYVPYKTFSNFINGLQETGLPAQIDKSIMGGMSGGAQSSIIGALDFLMLTTGKGKPTDTLQQLVDAKEENRGPILRSVLEGAYQFLFSGAIDLKRATTKQIEDAFRAQGTSGSTVVKCIAFFLSAAKVAGIEVSQHVKTPSLVRNQNPGKRQTADSGSRDDYDPQDTEDQPGSQRLNLPVLGKPDVVLIFPPGFTQDDWKFIKPILEAYIARMLGEDLLK